MKQLGIIFDNLLPQQAFLDAQNQALKAINSDLIKDATIFYINKSSLMNQPRLSTCHIKELCAFEGDVIATSILSAIKLLRFPIEGQKYFYLQNLEFMDFNIGCDKLFSIYRNPNLIYLVRSELHQKVFANNFNHTPKIMNNFDLSQL